MDIDIDVANRDEVLDLFPGHVPAMRIEKGRKLKHVSGVYFHDVPTDPLAGLAGQGLCSIPYEEAEDRGYFKVDVLNLHKVYEDVRDEDHLIELMEREPDWDLLMDEVFVNELFQVGNEFETLCQIAPRSVMDLAIAIAIIRPAKRYLIGQSRERILEEIWLKPDVDANGTNGKVGNYYKKSHAVSYAVALKVHMNILAEKKELT